MKMCCALSLLTAAVVAAANSGSTTEMRIPIQQQRQRQPQPQQQQCIKLNVDDVSVAEIFQNHHKAKCLLGNPEYSALIYERDKFILALCTLELLMSTGCYVIIISSMLRQANSHVALYDRINALDQKLMREFGANLNYHKLMLKNGIQVGLLALVYLAAISLAMKQALPNANEYLVGSLVFLYAAITCGLHVTCYMHSNFAEMLRVRFRLLQKLLDANYLRKMFPQSPRRTASLHSLVDMVRTLHEFIDSVNEVHRVGLSVGVAHDFMTVITVLYLVFGHSLGERVNYTFFAQGILWLFLPLHKFITAPVYCDMAIKEGKRCLRLVEHIDIRFPNVKSAKLLVETTMHWCLSNKFEFTCGLNMIYNRTIIATITAVIFNYLLVVIQFRMTQLMGEQMGEQKTQMQDWIIND
ncbi:putative gustatory receptor 57a [Anastrepha ludens]|uniref:putative gustatory receptor 57a n=1 Tax=Anastrepha ludens TaxID=28586 RepID=UPI0023B0C516|nr:putative gustatory receptor 57a [Anastrepha ludens]